MYNASLDAPGDPCKPPGIQIRPLEKITQNTPGTSGIGGFESSGHPEVVDGIPPFKELPRENDENFLHFSYKSANRSVNAWCCFTWIFLKLHMRVGKSSLNSNM